jgi:hypothetical protein
VEVVVEEVVVALSCYCFGAVVVVAEKMMQKAKILLAT